MARKRIFSSILFIGILMMLMNVNALANDYTMNRTKNVFKKTVVRNTDEYDDEELEEDPYYYYRDDYLKFKVSTPGLLTVIAQDDWGDDIGVRLCNSSKNLVGYRFERFGSENSRDLHKIYYGLGPGTYYLEIYTDMSYSVTARFDRYPNNGEANPRNGMIIPKSKAIAGVMSPMENYKVIDWYRINLPSCERIRINYDFRGDGDFRIVYTDKVLNYAQTQSLSSDNYYDVYLDEYYGREVSYKDFNTHIFDGRTKPGIRYIGVVRNEDESNAQYYLRWNTLSVDKSPELKVPGSLKKNYGSAAFKLGATSKSGKLTYASSNKNVAIVDSTGKVTLKGPGTTTITVTSPATARYNKATATVKLTVTLRQMVINSVTSPTKKRLTISWKKDTSGQGYEFAIAANKTFTSKTGSSKQPASKASYYWDGFPSGSTWYVRGRLYKKVGTKTYYGPWSAVKTVKIK